MRLLAVACALLALSACGKLVDEFDSKPELTSPCVSLEGSSCGPKRPANRWIYESYNTYS